MIEVQHLDSLMQPDCVLLTIHGVTSDNSGLAALANECTKRIPGLVTDCFFYQNMRFKDLTESTQKLIFQQVCDKIELVWVRDVRGRGASGGNKKLYIVAHSFGTLAVIRALEMHIPEVEIEGLILLGSIVPRAHKWDGLIRTKQLRRAPLAVVRPFDFVVDMASYVRGENSGAAGFIANGQYRVYETFKFGGHTAYYPNDVDDIVTAMATGVDSVRCVSHDAWKVSCNWPRRLLRSARAVVAALVRGWSFFR